MAKLLAAVIDDFPDWREKVVRELESHGIKVVAKAGTLDSALALVPKLEALGVTVVTLDGSMDKSTRDGDTIGRAIHTTCPHILRVGMSTFLDGVDECDVVVGKDNLSDLTQVIIATLSQK